MFHIFSIDGLSVWICVEADNVFVARCLVLVEYHYIKNVTYIGEFKSLSDIYLPEDFTLKIFDNDSFVQFKNEYSFNFNYTI